MHVETDVLVIGAGGAGMYAAIAAARENVDVLLVDKNMVGRGGATIMAQMTVAAALGEAEPDSWEEHLEDTLAAGKGLCNEPLAALLCRLGPERAREMDDWGVGWAREQGHIRQVVAPGHRRKRCCYVDFLNTGPAVASTLRRRVGKEPRLRRVSNVAITDLVVSGDSVRGALGISVEDGERISIAAKSTVVATGGLTKLYTRSSASTNMAGDGYALALRAGAELIDMEFVQFFPIGHLAPRLVGMDPIMWDPFRYKLGGRLLNGRMEEFVDRYGGEDAGTYTVTRDLATYAICQEVAAGRGSPHGGAYLSFTHIATDELRAAFGPVIDRLLDNGIDLGESPVEVAPIAHYHMGGIRVNDAMASSVDGLFAAGEAVGGASGANRLSGNAITEALVFGHGAGVSAARAAKTRGHGWDPVAARRLIEPQAEPGRDARPPAISMLADLKRIMWELVGPFRNRQGLERALTSIRDLRAVTGERPPVRPSRAFDNENLDWHELDAALLVAESVTLAALAREESRGAHQRDDFPRMEAAYECHQVLRLTNGALATEQSPLCSRGERVRRDD